MGLPLTQPLCSIDEYLTGERAAEERHEYIDGQVYAMAGESGAHADISTNLVGTLHGQLTGKPCRVRSKDTKVYSGPVPEGHRTKGMFSYPDLVVLCGEPRYHDAQRDIVLNPSVIIEVLSPSTEAFDRGEKFLRYQRWNSTLTDYLLVWQSAPIIEHYIRRADGSWSYYVFEGLEQRLTIPSLECSVGLAEVYDRVAFPVEKTGEGASHLS
jgi:Uma2 family endonuclease